MNSLNSILVTGGAGYIASRLIPNLLDNDYCVGLMGRSLTKTNFNNVDLWPTDITHAIKPPNKNYDVIVHLASANDADSKNVTDAILSTTLGTRNVLKMAVEMGIKRFIYFSTFQVYGIDSGYVNESTGKAPKNDYALTHWFAEEYVEMYQQLHGIETIIVRPTNIFGCPPSMSHDRWTLVPSCFCQEAVEKQQITLLSSGRQYRDFISLDSTASTIESIIRTIEPPSIVNLAGGKSYTIKEVALMVKTSYEKLFNRPCDLIIHSDSPQKGEPLNVDISVASSFYTPQTSTHSSLKKEIEKILILLGGAG